MSEIEADAREADLLRVRGEVSFDSVPALLEQGRVLLAGRSGRLRLDLSGVTRADSAGLALLIEWLRIARRQRTEVEYRHVPPQLLAIARVGGVEALLPLGDGA